VARAAILGSLPTGRFPPHGLDGVWRHSFPDGSFIEYSGGTIAIEAAGDIKLKAAGDIAIEAAGKVTIRGARIDLN